MKKPIMQQEKNMKMKKIRLAVLGSLFAAIICAVTLLLQIPVPSTHGYINPGDCFVIIAGAVLGPVYGALAAGIGSALADFITGYAVYVPATFVIKAVMAAAVFLIARKGKKTALTVLASLVSETVMTAGYFLYEFFVLKFAGAALSELPMNLIQGAFAVIVSVPLLISVNRSEKLRKYIYSGE